LVKQSLGASLAIEAFVFGWGALSDCQPLPSDSAAQSLLKGESGSVLHVLGTMAARSVIAAVGIGLAGEKDIGESGKKANAGVTAIEAVILLDGAVKGAA